MADIEAPPWLKGLPLAPEYHPTEVEFEDPIGYILKIEQEALQFGICKIVPPYLKAPKRIVINNLNSSLALSHDAPTTTAHGSSTPMSRSMGPTRSMSGTVTANVSLGLQDGGKARFTTRRQQLGWTVCKSNALPQSVTHKLVWQSGDSYTLEQFEAKAKAFSRNRLGTSRELAPMSIETLFWKAACEKSIAIEYANDIPGSAFAKPSEARLDSSLRFLKRQWGLDEEPRFKPALEDGLGGKEEEQEDVQGTEPRIGDEAELCKGSSNSETGHGSGCKLSNSAWNMRNVARSPGSLLRFMPDEVPGVTTPMVYIGMLFSWFAWHVEDHELHSLNYLHTGAPKTWYAVPGEAAPALEEVVRVHGYGSQLNARDSFARLGEKTTVMSPEVLVAAGVPCCRLVQNAGEYVVTFPRAYHLGFSHGFNCGEAANFATPGWLDVAREAAARRAAMNYLPMLSHQQLLYTLAMSLTSRSSRGSTSEEGSSRLKENKRLGEEIVKSMFVNDVIDHNTLLGKLLDGGVASCLQVSETKCLSKPPPDTLQQVLSKQIEIGRAVMCAEEADIQDRTLLPLSNPPSTDMLPEVHSKSSLADTSHESQLCTGATALSLDFKPPSVDSEDLNELHLNMKSSAKNCSDGNDFVTSLDWGTLPCAACGVLCYTGMAVVQPSQTAATAFRPLQSHVLGEGLESSMTGVLSARADTKSADFHILPPAPSLELEETIPSEGLEDEQIAVREILTHDLSDKLPLAKDHLNDATPDAEVLHDGLASSFSESIAVVSRAVKSAGGGVNVVDMHSKGESLETAETLKHEVSTVLLEVDVTAQVSMNQLEVAKQKSHKKWHSEELDVCPSIAVGVEPSPDKHLNVKPAVPGPSVLDRVPKEAGGSSVCDRSTSQTQQLTEEMTEGRIVGHRKGEMTISSLQLLAAVYDGDSEADEDDENKERREEVAEEISVVGFPHLGTGGRLIDSVGLSADAPWDGISRSLPGIECPSSFKQERKDKSCAFTSGDVVSVSEAMARVFSSGGLLPQGVNRGTCTTSIHRAGLTYGDGLQFTASLMPSEKEFCGLKTVLNREEREEFQPDLKVVHVEKHVIEVGSLQTNKSGHSNAILMEVSTESNLAQPPGSPNLTGRRLKKRAVLAGSLDLGTQVDEICPTGLASIGRKNMTSPACKCYFKLETSQLERALRVTESHDLTDPRTYESGMFRCDVTEGSVLPLGECVICQSTHESFFESPHEMPTTHHADNGRTHPEICAGKTSATVSFEKDCNLGSLEVSAVLLASDRIDLGINTCSLQVKPIGEGSPSSTVVSNNNSVGPKEAANRSTWQALGCSTSFPSDVVNEGMLVEVGETQINSESATGLLLKGVARPRLLCLEHAVVAQQQLESIGGAHVIIVCHSSFAKVEQQAKQVSSEIGRQHQWRFIPFQRVGDKELRIIRAAVAEEENMQGHSDWVGQLGSSVHEHDKILAEIPDRVSRDSFIGEQTRELRGRAVRCRNFLKEKKLAVVGRWCGRGWQSDQLHPLLGGCRFMASQAEVTVLPPNSSTSNILENGRSRKLLRASRFGEYSYDGRVHFEARKSGRKRKTVLDLTIDHSDDDGEDRNRVLTIVCSNSTARIPNRDDGYPHTTISERTNLRNNRSEKGQALEAAPEQAQPMWEKLGKRKKKDHESAKVSIRSISNSAQESAVLERPGCPTPLQRQYDCCTDAQPCSSVEGGMDCTGLKDNNCSDMMLIHFNEISSTLEGVGPLQHTSTVKSSSNAPFLSSPEESNLPQASANQTLEDLWQEVPIAAADSLPLPLGLSEKTPVQLGRGEAPASTSEFRVEPPGGAVVTSATALHLCPDGALHSEASTCCTVIGGFLQRGAKLQALQKLCQLRGTHVSDSCSPLTTRAQISSRETLSRSNTTRPRLIVRLKRKPSMGATQVVKKPKLVEGDARVETLPSFLPGETGRLANSPDRDDAKSNSSASDHNSCENNFTVVTVSGSSWKNENDLSPCRNNTSNQGDETLPCTLAECAQVATCFTLPMQTPNIHYSSFSNCCTKPSSQAPSNEPGSQYPWPPCLVPIVVPPTGRVRSRRTKSMRWKSCIQVSPVRDEGDVRQTWEEDAMRDADFDDMVMIKQDLETNNCVGREADPDFFSNSSCLTSSSTMVRLRRVTTPRMADWRVDDVDINPDEEEEEDTFKKRRKVRKSSSQKPGEELEGKFQCDLDGCYMAFDTEEDLELHKRNRCTWKGCGKHFHMHKYLLQHRRVHLSDRPLKCPWKGCPQAFKWAWARTEHIRVHTGERPYKCSVSGCGQTFRFVSDFSRHKRNTGHRPS